MMDKLRGRTNVYAKLLHSHISAYRSAPDKKLKEICFED